MTLHENQGALLWFRRRRDDSMWTCWEIQVTGGVIELRGPHPHRGTLRVAKEDLDIDYILDHRDPGNDPHPSAFSR